MMAMLAPIAVVVLLLVASMAMAQGGGTGRAVDLDVAARHPAPGTVSPSAIAFTPDGSAVTYLLPEGEAEGRVLWRVGADGGEPPGVVARPPGEGNTDENVSPEEALRRERMRLRDSGISQIARSSDEDASIIPLRGDLYLLRGDGPLRRLTETEAPEIDPKFAPGGDRVAFVREGALHVIELVGGEEIRLTEGSGDGVSHGLAEFIAQEELGRSTGYWWSPDGGSIAYQETDERHIPEYVIAHQADGAIGSESHRYPFAGADNARVRLGVLPSRGGPTRWLDLADEGEEVYLARVEWEDEGSLLVQVLPRDQKSLRLVRIDVETNVRATLIEERSDAWVNLHDDLRVVPGTGELVWATERSGFKHLMLLDRDGRPIRQLTSGDWPVDAVVSLDAGRREVWFLAGRESPLRRDLYRVSIDGGPIERFTAGEGSCSDAVVGPGADRVVVTVSTAGRPPVSTLHDRSGRLLATLADSGKDPRLAGLDLVMPQLSEFENRDGVVLYGAFYPPRGMQPGGKAPLVVLVYGGPHVQRVTDSWGLTADMTAQFLSARGFAVWKCDNRGSSRRGLAFEAALDRDMGTVEVRDQEDGVRFVASAYPGADADRVGITGGSYGGYLTIRCLLLAPGTFDAGVAIAPVTDWDSYDTAYTERYMGTPADNAAGYAASTVLDKADRLEGGLLLIHGMLDENVHFRHTSRFVAALIRAGKEFEVLPIPDERHSTRKEENRRAILGRTARFFGRWLGEG